MALTPTETPEETFGNRVKPPYDEYMLDPGTEWKAQAAAYGVGHIMEWLYEYYRHHDLARLRGTGGLPDFREMLFKQCLDLRIVFDVAEASKHRFLTKRTATVPSSTDAFLAGERLTLPDGQFFDEVLRRAYNFLKDWLA